MSEATKQASADQARSVVHASFHLERTYDAPVEHVFTAFSDAAAKAKWFGGDAGSREHGTGYLMDKLGETL